VAVAAGSIFAPVAAVVPKLKISENVKSYLDHFEVSGNAAKSYCSSNE
jgi:hypothetical protein